MYCPNNYFRCVEQGFCNCHDERTAEAAGGCGGILFLAAIGIFAAFLYPAIKIFRSNIEYKTNDSPKFAGAVWLFTSPLFGFLANILYQVTFALGACAAEALQSKITNSIYIAGMFLIYALAIGLAVIAFVIKNRTAIKLFFTESENRSVGKTATLAGLTIMVLLTVLAFTGVAFTVTSNYFSIQSDIQNTSKKDAKLISTEKVKFNFYVGTYKFTTRNESELFVVTKSSDGKNLRLIIDGEKGNKTNNGCLLTPNVEGNLIYYSVSDCEVNGKQSPLEKVYFRIENNKTKMNFIYNVRASGDTLEKIK